MTGRSKAAKVALKKAATRDLPCSIPKATNVPKKRSIPSVDGADDCKQGGRSMRSRHEVQYTKFKIKHKGGNEELWGDDEFESVEVIPVAAVSDDECPVDEDDEEDVYPEYEAGPYVAPQDESTEVEASFFGTSSLDIPENVSGSIQAW